MNTVEQLRAGELAGSRRIRLACGLSKLPDDLPRLRHLRILFCSDNQFTELPAVLGQCRQLSMIGFKANQIRHVPAATPI